ncbi:MAG: hypothetical protein ACRDPT_16455 [Streptomycetales bacterium]
MAKTNFVIAENRNSTTTVTCVLCGDSFTGVSFGECTIWMRKHKHKR